MCERSLRQRKQDKKPVSPTYHSLFTISTLALIYTRSHTHHTRCYTSIQYFDDIKNNNNSSPKDNPHYTNTFTKNDHINITKCSKQSNREKLRWSGSNTEKQQKLYNDNFSNWWWCRAGVDYTFNAGYHKDNEIITRVEFPGSGHA